MTGGTAKRKAGPSKCGICHDALDPRESAEDAGLMNCSHSKCFHQGCLERWLQRNPNCPVCQLKHHFAASDKA